MRQEISVQDGKVFFSLFGSLYVEEAAVLRQKPLMHIDKGYNHFVVNLSNVDYIDSSGLGVLVAIHKRSLQHGGSVAITGLKGTVKELFELTRLNKVFEVK